MQRPWIKTVKRKRVRTEGERTAHPFYMCAAWRKFRRRYIDHLIRAQMMDQDPKLTPGMKGYIFQYSPVCERCYKQLKYGIIGKPERGEELHHVKDFNPENPYDTQDGKYGEPLDEMNVELLCKHHHYVESQKKKRYETQ